MIYDGYDCVIDKPEMDDIFIAHYGVKGMKWHKHLKRAVNSLYKKTPMYKKKRAKALNEYIGKKIADDVASGRYGLRDNNNLGYAGSKEETENAKRYNKWRNEAVADDAMDIRYQGYRLENSPYENLQKLGYGRSKYDREETVRDAYKSQLYANKKKKK